MTAPHLSPWIEAAPFVFISGQLPLDPSVQISSDDVSQQTTQALENLGSLLAKLGLAVHDVVKTTVWLRRDGDFAASMKATPRFQGCSSGALNSDQRTGAPEALVEIEAIAVRRSTR